MGSLYAEVDDNYDELANKGEFYIVVSQYVMIGGT